MTRREILVEPLSMHTGSWRMSGIYAPFELLVTVGDWNRANPEVPITWDDVHTLIAHRNMFNVEQS